MKQNLDYLRAAPNEIVMSHEAGELLDAMAAEENLTTEEMTDYVIDFHVTTKNQVIDSPDFKPTADMSIFAVQCDAVVTLELISARGIHLASILTPDQADHYVQHIQSQLVENGKWTEEVTKGTLRTKCDD